MFVAMDARDAMITRTSTTVMNCNCGPSTVWARLQNLSTHDHSDVQPDEELHLWQLSHARRQLELVVQVHRDVSHHTNIK